MAINNTRDKRTQQTRSRLYNALLELLNECDQQDITIKALTQKAGIARQTFYSNYEGIEDILLDQLEIIADDFFSSMEQDLVDKNYNKLADTIIFNTNNHIELFSAIHKIGCSNKIYNRYFEHSCKIKKTFSNCNKLSDKDLLVTQFFTGGFYMLFYEWITSGMKTPITDLTVILRDALKFLATK